MSQEKNCYGVVTISTDTIPTEPSTYRAVNASDVVLSVHANGRVAYWRKKNVMKKHRF